LVIGGALAAALAGFGVGAQTRPIAPLASQALGPRMDFDLAAHTLPRATQPRPPTLLAARSPAPNRG